MDPLDPADGVTNPGRGGGARPFGAIAEPPAPPVQTGSASEFADERVTFGRKPGRALDVVARVRLALAPRRGQPAGRGIRPGPARPGRGRSRRPGPAAPFRRPDPLAATSWPGTASRTARSRRPLASRSCAARPAKTRVQTSPSRRNSLGSVGSPWPSARARAVGRRSSSARARSPCSRAPSRSHRVTAWPRWRAASSQRPSAAASSPSCRATGPVVNTAAPTTAN